MTQTMMDLMMPVLTALLALLAAYAVNLFYKLTAKLKAETTAIKNDEQRQLLLDAIYDIELLTTKTVGRIEQTTAKALREAIKNGEKPPEEMTKLFEKAYLEIYSAVTPDAMALINKHFGNFSQYVTNVIETKVLEYKQVT